MNQESVKCPMCGEDVNKEAEICEYCDSVIKDGIEQQANDAPSLWNPQAAVNWSLLFTPVFGAWLHAINWKALGEEEQSKKSMYWVYGGFAFLILYMFLPDKLGRALPLGFLVAWYFLMGKKLIKHLKDKNIIYRKKDWTRPIGVAGGAYIVLIVCALLFSSNGRWNKLEKQSSGIVTGILQDNGYGRMECVSVKIKDEITDNLYNATAILSDGQKIEITIYDKKTSLLVTIKSHIN